MQTEKGFRVKLDTVPVGGGEQQGIWFSVFDRDDKPQRRDSAPQRPSRPSQGAGNDNDEDDLPF